MGHGEAAWSSLILSLADHPEPGMAIVHLEFQQPYSLVVFIKREKDFEMVS